MSAAGGFISPNFIARVRSAWRASLPHALFGLRLWASVTLALLVSYWLELDNAYWAATSAGLVSQPSLGLSLRKGRFRAIGTVVGAIAIIFITAAFPQSRIGLLAALALWSAACSFVTSVLRNFAAYAAGLAGVTAAVVFGDSVNAPLETVHIAIIRASEISIGVAAASLVSALTDFGDARDRLARTVASLAKRIATGFDNTLAGGTGIDTLRVARRTLILEVVALDPLIDETIGESSRMQASQNILHAAAEALFMALAAWRTVANNLEAMSPAASAPGAEDLRAALAAPAASLWLRDPATMRAACGTEARRVMATPTPDAPARLLVDSVSDALLALERAANGLVLLVGPARPWPDRAGTRFYRPDLLPPLLDAVRVFLAVAATSLIWVVTAWPGGEGMITFTAVGAILFAPRAERAYQTAAGYAIGAALAAGLAAIVNFAVLPALTGFTSLALVLASVLVPCGALMAATRLDPIVMGMTTLFVPLLAPANPPTYNPANFFNEAAPILAGTIAACVTLRLIPPLSAPARTRRLLASSLRDMRCLAVRPRWPGRHEWAGLVCRRLADLPLLASLDDMARLLAALSVGEAVISLRGARATVAAPELLDAALASLAAADIGAATDQLTRFAAAQTPDASPPAEAAIRAHADAAVIREALNRHRAFFASAAA
jgi:uncharacterized membrane protein YccC